MGKIQRTTKTETGGSAMFHFVREKGIDGTPG
jgi:hypothetical protein